MSSKRFNRELQCKSSNKCLGKSKPIMVSPLAKQHEFHSGQAFTGPGSPIKVTEFEVGRLKG